MNSEPNPTDRLFNLLSSIHPLSDDFKNAITKELTVLSLPKNFLLLEAPKVSAHAYFLNTGFAISYTYIRGKKQIEGLWSAGQIMASVKSFFEQIAATEFIELVAQSEVVCISYTGVMRLFERFSEAHFIQRVIVNQYYEHCRDRIRDMQYLTAAERYEKLLRQYPGIQQIIPQEHIASFLGITSQSLSRIKRNESRS